MFCVKHLLSRRFSPRNSVWFRGLLRVIPAFLGQVGSSNRVPASGDEAYAMRGLQTEAGTRQREIAHRMNLDQSMVSERLKLLGLPVAVQRKLNRGDIPIDLALRSLEAPEGAKRDAAIKSLGRQTVTLGRGEPVPPSVSDSDVRNV